MITLYKYLIFYRVTDLIANLMKAVDPLPRKEVHNTNTLIFIYELKNIMAHETYLFVF